MAENNQSPARSPSQIAADARGGVHHSGGMTPGRSPGQIAADAVRGMHGQDAGQAGHVLHSEGGGPDGKGWVDWVERQRQNQHGDNAEDQNQRGRGRSLPEEEKQREQERDKGRSLMESVREWVHEHEMGCGY